MKTNYKGIKPKEIVWVTYYDINHNLTYCMTSNEYRDTYYLYEYKNNEWVKTKYKSDNPQELSKQIDNKPTTINEEKITEIDISTNAIKVKRGRPPKSKLF